MSADATQQKRDVGADQRQGREAVLQGVAGCPPSSKVSHSNQAKLDVGLLSDLLDYDADSGAFRWAERLDKHLILHRNKASMRRWNAANAGQKTFTSETNGYLTAKILGKKFRAHRVAFAIAHGRWPVGEIDHINGDRSDNRICNLREVSQEENARNRRRQSNNRSGVNGVTFIGRTGKWRVALTRNGKRHFAGEHSCFARALRAASELRGKLGFHENHGRVAR